ncbi:MAG TPA: efflux RND transporter periplasmic adaptor subunit [Syntrophomonadaceae bacterium]|nr:efflux RND transporter periplasmic adaptor subunit [Syntrophomonadaceae bacterium]
MAEKIKHLSSHKKLIIVVIVMVLLVLLFNTLKGKKTNLTQASNSTSVEVKQVQLTDWTSSLTYKANLEPMEQATVSSKVSGQVVQVLFENGDQVSQGQALISLDVESLQNQLQAAQINLQKLQIVLNTEQNNYDRTKALFDSGAKSKTDLENSESDLKTAQANVQAQQVSIDSINISLNNSIIRAPISGEIGTKNVNPGQYVSPGAVMADIKNNSSIKCAIQLKQSDLDKVQVGEKVVWKVSQEDASGYEGTIKTIAASADSTTRLFNCQIQLENPDNKLHSGVFGYIQISDGEKKQVLAVPLAALTGSEGSYSVFTVDNNVARKHSVNIGEIQNDMAEVTSGLQAGAKVIITNLNTLQEGDAVQDKGQGAA